VNGRLVARNEAGLVTNKPRAPLQSAADTNCWTADDAAQFLRTAHEAGAQSAALWTLALDTGMRRAELAGLTWSDVDLRQGRVRVRQQLLRGGAEPVFVAPKGKRTRTISVAPETVDRLKVHKAHQAQLKMRHRQDYRDLGLVFAKEPTVDGRRQAEAFGTPIAVNTIAERELNGLIQSAGVPRITVHGLRHTSATLLLQAGVPTHVVQQRLGHKDASTTMDVYGHVLPGQQEDAARRLADLLYRR
jgi:integrase